MVNAAVRVVVWIYIAWLALSALVVMPALNILAPWYMEREYGRELRSDIILFNPFNLSVEIRGADLREPDGSAFASLDLARANLSLRSLTGSGIIFDDITVTGLELYVRRRADGSFNFDDLLPADNEPETPSADSDKMPAVTVRRLVFDSRRIGIRDEAREKPFSTHYEGLAITVTDLSTVIEEGKPYRIDAYAEAGGSLHWQGTVSVPAATSEGSLAIRDLSLVTLWRFAEPWLDFKLESGRLTLEGNYQLSWQDALDYSITQGQLTLSKLDARPEDASALPNTWVSLSELAINDINLNSDTSNVTLDEILATGLNVAGWSEAGTFSLIQMFDLSGLPASEEPPSPAEEEPGPEWSAKLGRIALQDTVAKWRSEFTDPPELLVTPLESELRDIRWPLEGPSQLSLGLAINGVTKLNVGGQLDLGSGDGALNYTLEALPLTWVNPNLPAALKAHITSGELGVEGDVSLAAFSPSVIDMNGALTDFSGQMAEAEEALTRWDSVRWQQLSVDLDQRIVSMAQLLIHDYEGRVHILEDGSINASNVWQEELGDEAEEIAEELDFDKPWEISLPEILISSSAIDFKDESLPLPFRTVIGDVNGEILDISTDPGARTKVDIQGEVDGYAPVSLSGSAEPFTAPPALDLKLTFNGVDLVLLTPYSGTYAGYAIERGLLSLKLEYSLQEDRLKGNNEVVIDQLKLGDKVDSDKAIDLPLELALALLTDVNGVIDLEVPVEGDVNDPEFAIGSVIVGAFVNLITKAVTAPFSLLASLVGSEDDLQRMAFGTGSAELNDAGKAKLDELGQALAQRPKLTLIVRGRLNLDADREKLQEQALEAELLAQGIAAEQVEKRGDDYLNSIEQRYSDSTGASAEGVTFREQYAAVLATVPINDKQLQELAQARAVAVKDYLVNQQNLPADRAVIEIPSSKDEAEGFSGVELDLDN